MDLLDLLLPRRRRRAATLDAWARRFELRRTRPATKAERKAARATWRTYGGTFTRIPIASNEGLTDLTFENQRGAPRDDGGRLLLRTQLHPEELAFSKGSTGDVLTGVIAGCEVMVRSLRDAGVLVPIEDLLWIEMPTALRRATLLVTHPTASWEGRPYAHVLPTPVGNARVDAACVIRMTWPTHLEPARPALVAFLAAVVELPAWSRGSLVAAGDGRLGLLLEGLELPDAERAEDLLTRMATLAAAIDATPELPPPPMGPVRYHTGGAYRDDPGPRRFI